MKKCMIINKALVLISMIVLMVGMMSGSVLGASGISIIYPNGGA